jgi:hypothetical protein
MDEKVAKLKTPEDCAGFEKNALRLGRPDLADEARARAVELRAKAYGATTDAERECLEAVYAYEAVLTARNGRRTPASRTWQMIKRHGILGAVERAVNRPQETVGYTALLDMGLQKYAFESVVVRHSKLFSPETVRRSAARTTDWAKD